MQGTHSMGDEGVGNVPFAGSCFHAAKETLLCSNEVTLSDPGLSVVRGEWGDLSEIAPIGLSVKAQNENYGEEHWVQTVGKPSAEGGDHVAMALFRNSRSYAFDDDDEFDIESGPAVSADVEEEPSVEEFTFTSSEGKGPSGKNSVSSEKNLVKDSLLIAQNEGASPRLDGNHPNAMVYIEGKRSVPTGEVPLDGAQGVDIHSFYVSKNLVTNADYQKFIETTSSPPPTSWPDGAFPAGEGQAPVTVTLQEARGYASWAEMRLPTQDELVEAEQLGVIEKNKDVPEWLDDTYPTTEAAYTGKSGLTSESNPNEQRSFRVASDSM